MISDPDSATTNTTPPTTNNSTNTPVSVVIPVYNAEAFLAETLNSVLATTYAPLEVIVIDDGSTDRSRHIALDFAERDPRVKVLHQENQGVCRARNHAIAHAAGRYILPVDADNLIEPQFVEQAVAILDASPEVKVVAPRADFFGERTGEWKLPPFSLRRLARRNIMDTCAMYRREEWERIGGYCETIIAREDWEFWISMLKDGGEVVRLPDILLHYRVRQRSKRIADRRLKRHVIATLNRRHPEFFERELGGKLRMQRSWSKLINRLSRILSPRRVVVHPDHAELSDFVKTLPTRFAAKDGTVIFKNRNEIRAFHTHGLDIVVKEFKLPNLINRIAYGLLRSSKAERSYRYAEMLRAIGIDSPAPIGFVTLRRGLLFSLSYYASLRSACPISYMQLYEGNLPDRDDYLRAIGRITARLHENGWIHTDYSRGNILLGRDADGRITVDLVDLNRLRRRTVDLATGSRNFERLPLTTDMLAVIIEAYATERGFDVQACMDEALKSLPPQS